MDRPFQRVKGSSSYYPFKSYNYLMTPSVLYGYVEATFRKGLSLQWLMCTHRRTQKDAISGIKTHAELELEIKIDLRLAADYKAGKATAFRHSRRHLGTAMDLPLRRPSWLYRYVLGITCFPLSVSLWKRYFCHTSSLNNTPARHYECLQSTLIHTLL